MKIAFRLLGAMYAIALSVTLASAIIVASATVNSFRSFVFEGDEVKASLYAKMLGEYLDEHGGWYGVVEYLATLPSVLAESLTLTIHHEDSSPAARALAESGARALFSDRVALADGEGRIVADTAGLLVGTRHPERHLKGGAAIASASGRAGTVLVGSMIDSSLTEREERFVRSTSTFLGLAFAAAMALAALLGTALSRGISRPLARLAEHAGHVAGGDFRARVPREGDEELAKLADAFNAMTTRLSEIEEDKRRIIADSAHELRTPATLIRGMVEAMLDGIYAADRKTLESLHAETLRLDGLVTSLRELESIESDKFALDLADSDLASVAERLRDGFATAIRARGAELRVVSRGGAVARVDAMRVAEAAGALLDNALKYGGSGILVEAGATEDFATLAIEDDGDGIPADDRPRIFDRFYRVDKSRSSSTGGRGLGLPIAREIARAHGGDLLLVETASGSGARFELRLPKSVPFIETPRR